MTTRRVGLVRLFATLTKASLIAWAVHALADYFGWHLFSEAGGQILRAAF